MDTIDGLILADCRTSRIGNFPDFVDTVFPCLQIMHFHERACRLVFTVQKQEAGVGGGTSENLMMTEVDDFRQVASRGDQLTEIAPVLRVEELVRKNEAGAAFGAE